MAEQKTLPSDTDIDTLLDAVESEPRRIDARTLLELFRKATGDRGVVWGTNIIGFGSYAYRYASGRTGTSMRVGFAARKDRLTVYLPEGFEGYDELLDRVGPHTNGKSCLHIKKLDHIDLDVLGQMIAASFRTRLPNEVDS